MVVLLLIIFFIAGLYASVGHGGASGYLAVMSIYEFAPETLRPTALILNLFVAGVSFTQYYRAGYFNGKLFQVFAISSIPFAFLGGMVEVDALVYKRILGFALIVAVMRMLGIFHVSGEKRSGPVWGLGLLIGAGIGFFSGLIGIGGGIILSPVILLLGWGNVKETAAVSALFIWVNSLAGLVGMATTGIVLEPMAAWFVLVALAGGLLGGYIGSKKWNLKTLRMALSLVLIMACFKLIFT